MSLLHRIGKLLDKDQVDPEEFAEEWGCQLEDLEDPPFSMILYLMDEYQVPFSYFRDSFQEAEDYTERDIRMLVLDVDGVMTDGGMYFTENGDQIKKFNSKDGIAIMRLTKAGFPVVIISSGYKEGIVHDRAELLGIQRTYVGRSPKMEVLQKWMDEEDITIEQVAYIGDDINDLPVIQACGLSACPSDAMDEIKDAVDIILQKEGGRACVREFIDKVFPVA